MYKTKETMWQKYHFHIIYKVTNIGGVYQQLHITVHIFERITKLILMSNNLNNLVSNISKIESNTTLLHSPGFTPLLTTS